MIRVRDNCITGDYTMGNFSQRIISQIDFGHPGVQEEIVMLLPHSNTCSLIKGTHHL